MGSNPARSKLAEASEAVAGIVEPGHTMTGLEVVSRREHQASIRREDAMAEEMATAFSRKGYRWPPSCPVERDGPAAGCSIERDRHAAARIDREGVAARADLQHMAITTIRTDDRNLVLVVAPTGRNKERLSLSRPSGRRASAAAHAQSEELASVNRHRAR